MKNNSELDVNGTVVRILRHGNADYVCLTDIAALRNPVEPKDVVKNWMRSRATISFLGLWEKLHNPDFKGVEFDPLLAESGKNSFTMSPSRWIELTNAIGLVTKNGKNGGTFAQKDIAFKHLIHSSEKQFPYASCADISGSGRLFRAHFSRF